MKEEEIIIKQAETLLEIMKVKAKCLVKSVEGNGYSLTIVPEEEPAGFIGYHGEVLSSFQRILQIIVYRVLDKKIELLVDVDGYRERQRERLEGITKNVAEKVVESKREAEMSSFSPFERKLIHTYINTHYSQLHTISEGVGAGRKLIISLRKEEK